MRTSCSGTSAAIVHSPRFGNFITRSSEDAVSGMARRRMRMGRAYGRSLPACQYVARRVAPPILVDGLRKSYGAQLALGGVSFEVAAGEIVGLLGPNGAGKSTTLGILATLLRFDAGRVAVAGHALPAGATRARRALGLVPQQVAVYPTLGTRENLRFFARAFELAWREAARRADAALDQVGLAAPADEPLP